jgi:hypothetical protein
MASPHLTSDQAEEESSGWDHWSKRVGILRVVHTSIEKGDTDPIYAGDETMWALCDNGDLDDLLLTSMQPAETGLTCPVSVRMCEHGEVAEDNHHLPATLVVAMGEPPRIDVTHALVTVGEPTRQVFGPALPRMNSTASSDGSRSTAMLLDHWLGRSDSSTLFDSCRKLA